MSAGVRALVYQDGINQDALRMTDDTASASTGSTELSPDFLESWDLTHRDLPKSSKVEKVLNTLEDGVNSTQGEQMVLNTVMVPAKAFVDKTGIASAIEKGINGFLEGMPMLMKGLDEVSKIHPFISVAVLAFKAVYTLEITRHNNDKKIISLYVEMKDMMEVLLSLKNVKDVDQIGPYGESIKGRMQRLLKTTVQDIKKCANTCDTYLKKKLVVKIFSGPVWEGKFADFATGFIKRRKDFEFTLSIHTAVGVDQANTRLVSIDSDTQEIKQKIDVLFELFKKFTSTEQVEMESFIESKGGKSALGNDEVVRELIKREAKLSPRGPDNRRTQTSTVSRDENAEFRREISEDPDQAIKMNKEFFDKKFEIQQRQIEEISRTVHKEGDRIISAVKSGPHDRLIDPDIYRFWKDMGWRSTVKARLFVLVLRDHFHEKTVNEENEDVPNSDSWALEYINLDRTQSIQEAFDDDTSGFITIKEVNRFTRLRPRDWSLPHWIAYWAIGWQMTATDYCEKIDRILVSMFNLVDKLKLINRRMVNQYLHEIWYIVTPLTKSIDKEPGTDSLRAKFEPWVTAEEERLKRTLEDLRYRIDTDNTLSLIVGPGRIEAFLLPLLYLILNHHLSIISLGRSHVIHKEELSDAVSTMWTIYSAAEFRVDSIRSLFSERRLDIKAQFKTFARGMFAQLQLEEDDTPQFYTNLKNLPDISEVDEVALPKEEDLDPKKMLNHPLDETTIDYSAYDPVIIQAQEEKTGSDAILGTWYGVMYYTATFSIRYTFEKDDAGEENAVRVTLQAYTGALSLNFHTVGHTSVEEDGSTSVHFKVIQTSGVHTLYDGKFSDAEQSIRGARRWGDDVEYGEFILKRSPELLRFYPGPAIIRANPARSRWNFALEAIRYRVQRDSWSASFFMDRFRRKKRFMELSIRRWYHGKMLDSNLVDELQKLSVSLTVADAQFYTSLINLEVETSDDHIGYDCDSCGSILNKVRVVCMDCGGNGSVDLCEDPTCLTGLVERDDLEKPHSPDHDVFKLYTLLHLRYQGTKEEQAKEALAAARSLLGEEPTETESASSDEIPGPTCSSCNKRVFLSPPCWSCTEPECENLFICDDCDSKGLGFNKKHDRTHAIVRCKPPAGELTTEQRLVALEDRLTRMEKMLKDELQSIKVLLPSSLITAGLDRKSV